ncbi:hypothetical protein TNCV_3261851 [Trichonephila clavipes]|nr:hypothetical protein TNCV_3261851 [Trichonephila clavipes]
MSFTRRPGSKRPRQTSRREDRHIKAGRRTTVNIDQVRSYLQRKSDEGVIEVEISVSSGSEYQSSCLEENRPRSREFGEQRGMQGKKTNLTGNQSGRKEQPVNKRKRSIGSKESLVGLKEQQHKKQGKR